MAGDGAAPAATFAELHVLPVGALADDLVLDVVARVSRAVAVPCRVLRPRHDVPLALVEGRDQLDADRLLAHLEERARPGAVLAALVARDVGSPLFTHFFGRSRLGGRALLVSLARLGDDPTPGDPRPAARRAACEVLHELGHVAGLRHCARAACLMRFAPTVDGVDVRGTAFCALCEGALPREMRRVRP